jgi:predicted acetyltransferase
MPVSIRDVKRTGKDRDWIESVYDEYLDSLSELNTGLFPSVNANTPQRDEIFASWFATEHSHPLLIAQGSERVGFALVTRPRIHAKGEKPVDFYLAEFFVRERHRRVGIGRQAAALIFDRFAGEWEIVVYQRNPGSVAFWRKVVDGYSRGRHIETTRHGEVRERFRSRPRPRTAG